MNRANFVDQDFEFFELSSKPDGSLAALERFVTHNDELRQLEDRIGRFNIFDALRVTRDELKHSNFLAWLLDPAESHGQGALFLRAVLMDLLSRARDGGYAVPVSPIQIDAAELHGLEVRREWRHIDLLIKCDDPAFIIAIENKIDTGEHSEQLTRYRNTIAQEFPGHHAMYVFLTREGDEPSDDGWCPTSYRDLHRVLSRVAKTHSQNIGDDVRTFLDHYLRLIGSRFMDDPRIDELCQTIYKNHRAAIDLIVERVDAGKGVVQEIATLIKSDGRFLIVRQGTSKIYFIPTDWQHFLPAVGTQKFYDPRYWLLLSIGVSAKRLACGGAFQIRPTQDQALRQEVIRCLASEPERFGTRSFFKNLDNIGQKWATLGKRRICLLENGVLLSERARDAILKHLDVRIEEMAKIREALQPIVQACKADRSG